MSLSIDTTRVVQQRLLSMGQAISEVLENEEIPYMLAFGSLLGAVRHKGFIPWDDDFDLFLFDDTYSVAISALRNKLPKNMFVENQDTEPLYFHYWAHVKDLGSMAICHEFPQDSLYSHKGISIDLYRTKRIKSTAVEGFINTENKRYVETRMSKGLITAEDYSERMNAIKEDELCSRWAVSGPEREVFAFPCALSLKFFEINDVLPLRKYSFEDIEFYGPQNADSVLKLTYGKYLELPPEDKRRSHYSAVEFYGD